MEQAPHRSRDDAGQNFQGMVKRLVEEAAALTESAMAYFAVTNEAETELTMIAWSKKAIAGCSMVDKPLIYPIETTGLWGDCIRERGAVITNDYENCTRKTKKGCPDGHVPVKRHMTVPVMAGQRIKGVLGVGNKEAEYTEKDSALLQSFANAAWPAIAQAKARAAK
ncbi:MAG: GAF domain-containing protein [Verrucomicrobia bacterium]|nr:GAF domain-containing protein [Verrucomicrobiota bacterium]